MSHHQIVVFDIASAYLELPTEQNHLERRKLIFGFRFGGYTENDATAIEGTEQALLVRQTTEHSRRVEPMGETQSSDCVGVK